MQGNTIEAEVEGSPNESTQVQVIQKVGSNTPATSLDGGSVAWLQCAAGFCIFFNTYGLNAFGTFIFPIIG